MNILYIADPNSIHDVRWINSLVRKKGFVCFVLPRLPHFKTYGKHSPLLDETVVILRPLRDPSTVRPLRTVCEILKIRRIIREFNIHIVHIMYAEPNVLWANGKGIFKIPIVLTTRGTDILKTIPEIFQRTDLLGRLVAKQYRRAFRQLDQITCTSQSQARVFQDMELLQPIHVIRTGIDLSDMPASREDVARFFKIGKPYVLMPRNMKPIYNHEFTLEAIALLDDRFRHDYAFVFVNSDGSDRSYISSISNKAASIDADIHFLNGLPRQQLLWLIKQSSVVVMNPHSDGSPVTAMEAMACKRPVIMPPLDYDPDIFSNVWFFDRWDAVALKDKIEEVLLMEGHELESVIRRNNQNVLLNANSEIEMAKVVNIYTDLVS